MEATAKVEDTLVSEQMAEVQQPSKKRSLEDVQRGDAERGDAEPNGSEPRQASSPEPEAKRAKTGRPGQDETESRRSVEDGEVLQTNGSQSGSPEGVEGQRATSPAVAASAPAHAGWNQGITSTIRTSLGGSKAAVTVKTKKEPSEPAPEKAPEPAPKPEPEQDPKEEAEPQPEPTPAPSQMDKSKGKNNKSSEAAQPAQPAAKTRKERRQERVAQVAAERQKVQEDLKKPWEYGPGLAFWLPNKKNILQTSKSQNSSWSDKFKSWCQSFTSRNIEQKELLTVDIVVAALLEYITKRAKWSKKKQGSLAANEARKPETRNDIAVALASLLKKDGLLPAMGGGTGAEDSPFIVDDTNDDDAMETGSNAAPSRAGTSAEEEDDQSDDGTPEPENARPGPPVMSEAEDLAQQRLYFPGLSESEVVCVFCASLGHTSSSCPRTACKFCEQSEPGHFSWNCPTRERCTKCRLLGHGKAQCTEKLVHLDEEGMECAACGSKSHLEDSCESLWRSYRPRRDSVKKVRPFPAYCAYCGAEGHYSSDCAIRGNQPRSQTWALKNRDLYVDRNAPDGPISDFTSEPPKPQFNLQIKGSAAKRNHIFYPDSDGSEEGEFIGQKVKPRAPVGNIQMSTNLQFGNFGPPPPPPPRQQHQYHGGWSAQQQPPLPPGPPPPGPPAGSYSRMSRNYNNSNNNQSRSLPPPPPQSNGYNRGGLPPKPPAPQSHQQQQHGYHNVPPPPNGPGPTKKPRIRQQGNSSAGSSQQQQQHHNGGGGNAGRRRGKTRRGGKQG
ncbi:zinc knuckle domain-containing protein [Colletotrichum musicola]|uniref:Zinc knuckle domain-containing protein n=1 Tax=Colletotrichum musicola TaxID=2175873 RepID=A0A8H6NVT1_9PEZI|nr:zinc knuckle domain-containing protein [Colletotrichum musicola]